MDRPPIERLMKLTDSLLIEPADFIAVCTYALELEADVRELNEVSERIFIP